MGDFSAGPTALTGATSWSGARRLLVLVVAAALGVVLPALRLAERTAPARVEVAAWADETYAVLRTRLAAGERIGVVVASGDPNLDGALSYSAQYALAPAVVEAVYLEDCLLPVRGPRCRLDAVPRVALPNPTSQVVGIFEQRLGLIPAGVAGRVLLLERRSP